MLKCLALISLMVGLSAPVQAASCNPAFSNSVVTKMNTIVSTSGKCRKVLYDDTATAGRICTTCQGTIGRLLSLQSTYQKNKSCFHDDPKIRGHFNELWSYKKDVDRLQRICGS